MRIMAAVFGDEVMGTLVEHALQVQLRVGIAVVRISVVGKKVNQDPAVSLHLFK